MNKGLGFTVSGIELVRENTTATKQQERDTLAAIKKMVEELGPQSYLATAFAGCFQDAEDNIDDDAAYSMKARLESAEKKLDAAAETIERLKSDISILTTDLENARSARDDAIELIKTRVPLEDDLADAVQVMGEKVYALKEQEETAAKVIVEKATEPDGPDFKQAVLDPP